MNKYLKDNNLLCKKWGDNPRLFYQWALREGYSSKKELIKKSSRAKHSEKNSCFRDIVEPTAVKVVRPKTTVNYNTRLECWFFSIFERGKFKTKGMYNTRQGALFANWAYCVYHGLEEPNFVLRRKSV